MNKYIHNIVLIFLIFIQTGISQNNTNNLSNSPYSLYGLGLKNGFSTGITNSLGRSGIAMPSTLTINNLNPASFGAISKERFLFDIGIKAEKETLFKDGNIESKFGANFSNAAIAFPITKKSGFGLTLIPFTNIGYTISGIESGIDGSPNTFFSEINGSGGINDIKMNYGYAFNKKLRLGISGSYLFGEINEVEIDVIDLNVLSISEESHYNGFRIGLGLQYEFNDKIVFGSVLNLPTKLKGNQTRTTVINGTGVNQTENNIESFKLPLELGFGIHAKLNESLFFNIDYNRNFWSATHQSDYIGNYVDQDFIGIGVGYTTKKTSSNYWERINYRAGFNMDNGNLAINDSRITNYGINFGLGFPTSKTKNSTFNFGYSYSQKGEVSNGLIKEKFHTLTLNISLEDLWFLKRKYE